MKPRNDGGKPRKRPSPAVSARSAATRSPRPVRSPLATRPSREELAARSPRATTPGADRPDRAATPFTEPVGRERFLPGGIRIVHEDAEVMVVDKPHGLPTVSPPDQEVDCVFTEVKRHVRDQMKRRGTRVWVIHRLDKEASGLLVFAKTERAFHWLKEEFRAKRVHRLYSAVVEGQMAEVQEEAPTPAGEQAKPAKIKQPPMGTIQSFLFEDDRGLVKSVAKPSAAQRGPRRGVSGEDEELGGAAKLAVTHWKVQQAGHGRTLLQVRLETGRKHQIRVHLSEMGFPIVGDRRYGAKTDPIGRLCLHAFELGFTHASTGKSLRFRSTTPGGFFGLAGEEESAASHQRDARSAKESRELPASTPEPAAKAPTPLPPAPAKPALREKPLRPAADPAIPGGTSTPPAAATTSWEHVAAWYDELIEDRGSDHHENIILPGTLRLLGEPAGRTLLDVACGQGVLCRAAARLGASTFGVDASPSLIDSARRLSAAPPRGVPEPTFAVGDARNLGALNLPTEFDAACCVMALMNIEPLAPVLDGIASHLRHGAPFVAVILHPAFRAPGQTSWGWATPDTAAHRGSAGVQFRRVDGYLSPGVSEIVMNPGAVARGAQPVTTLTYHRPLQTYIRALADAGLLIDAIEEWPSLRQSQPGPRAQAENRARREIPMFLAIRTLNARG